MIWIAPTAKADGNAALAKRLWDAGDQFRPKRCEVRGPSCGVRSVRQSTFAVRTSHISASLDYDAFVRIYEYFLGEFAMSEGHGGAEPSAASSTTGTVARRVIASDSANQFCTPSSIARLLTEVIEPYHGCILDPACGSGGMLVSSAHFVSEDKENPAAELPIHGVEKADETERLYRLNLAVHGLEGEIKHGGNINYYYDAPHDATGRFDLVPAMESGVSSSLLRQFCGGAERHSRTGVTCWGRLASAFLARR